MKSLIEQYRNNIKKIISTMTGSENEDIEQEVYIRTWKNLDKYKENGKFKSWINTIKANLCRDYMKSSYFRHSQNTVTEEDDLIQIRDEKENIESAFIQKQRQKRIMDAIDALKPKFKEVVIMYEMQDMSYEEISAIMSKNLKQTTKEEKEAKKAEYEKRLNLTEEQKAQIEKNKQKDKETMKPIFDKMKENKQAIKAIHKDATLSPEDKVVKSAEYEKELIDLKVKANELRKENMKNFENILTDDQKAEFAKIKEEQKAEMEKRRAAFKAKKAKKPVFGLPVQPKPIPVEK